MKAVLGIALGLFILLLPAGLGWLLIVIVQDLIDRASK